MKNQRIALVLTCMLTFCLPVPSLAQGAKVPATLRLDWVPGPHHIGPVLASQRGYYAREGIDLAVRPGKGSGSTVQVVASGSDQFGFADAGTMAVAVSKGMPVIMVNPSLMATLAEVPKEIRSALFGLNITMASVGWLMAGSVGATLLAVGGFEALGALAAGTAALGCVLALYSAAKPRVTSDE